MSVTRPIGGTGPVPWSQRPGRLRGPAGWVAAFLVAAVMFGAITPMDGQESAALDDALDAFWLAPDADAAAVAAGAVLAASKDFSVLYDRLRAGRRYTFGAMSDLAAPPLFFAPTGITSTARRNLLGLWHPFVFVVPDSYDPTRRYPVRFYLQGDTSRPASSAESGVRWLNYDALAREDSIVVFPGAWNGIPWWGAMQVDHMAAVLDQLKRAYNVDENRVFLLGSSDGGTGVYYHALVAATQWAAFLPFNGDPATLADPAVGVDTGLFASNMSNRPLLAVHGERDHIFPAASVASWMRLFERAGGQVTLRLKADYGHETRWWADEVPVMDRFMGAHPRDPLPDRVSWETTGVEHFNRAAWVVVDELGSAVDERAPETPNDVEATQLALGAGLWTDAPGRGVRIDLIQPGSPVEVGGLRNGDMIERIGDVEVSRFEQLLAAARANGGSTAEVTILRGGTRFLVQVALPAPPGPSATVGFPRERASGRIDVERRANVVDVRTRGIARFTLLLSSEKFDFSEAIRVVTNGRTSFEGMVSPSPEVLMKWAAHDNDRTMLFGHELQVTVPAD